MHGSAEQAALSTGEGLRELRSGPRKGEGRDTKTHQLFGGCSRGGDAHLSPACPAVEAAAADQQQAGSSDPAGFSTQLIRWGQAESKSMPVELCPESLAVRLSADRHQQCQRLTRVHLRHSRQQSLEISLRFGHTATAQEHDPPATLQCCWW